ncbi:hypothetical protein [Marinicellulosiphila megalodicopiae]
MKIFQLNLNSSRLLLGALLSSLMLMSCGIELTGSKEIRVKS